MSDQQRKVIVVTGGTRGIGFAIAKKLVAKHYEVIVTGTSEESLKQSGFSRESGYLLDLSSSPSIEEFVTALTKRFETGAVLRLVNNAGVCESSPIFNPRRRGNEFQKVWNRTIAINLTGTAYLTEMLLSSMRMHIRGGRIVNIVSQLGNVGRAGYSAYCASKFGLIGLTEVWSRELAHLGMTVNAVSPGWIKTEMMKADLAREASEMSVPVREIEAQHQSRLDQRRFNTPQEVANIVAFLLSPEASGITGRCIEMAGPSA